MLIHNFMCSFMILLCWPPSLRPSSLSAQLIPSPPQCNTDTILFLLLLLLDERVHNPINKSMDGWTNIHSFFGQYLISSSLSPSFPHPILFRLCKHLPAVAKPPQQQQHPLLPMIELIQDSSLNEVRTVILDGYVSGCLYRS